MLCFCQSQATGEIRTIILNEELLKVNIPGGCGGSTGIASVARLRQSEASHVVQAVDTVEEFVVVALSPKLEHRPAKQVELDGHFRRHGRVDHRRKLVGGKYSEEGIKKLSQACRLDIFPAITG